jgi:putative membrane protein
MDEYDRADLTRRKKVLIRLVVGFVFATKHYLRSEGGAHHVDMKGGSFVGQCLTRRSPSALVV